MWKRSLTRLLEEQGLLEKVIYNHSQMQFPV